MMVDCGAKRLEVAACTTAVVAMFDVGRTSLSLDRRQFFAAPEFVEPFDPGFDLELVARLSDIGQIDRQHIGTFDVLDILPAAFGLILLSDGNQLRLALPLEAASFQSGSQRILWRYVERRP
jgi:hypothetical protein